MLTLILGFAALLALSASVEAGEWTTAAWKHSADDKLVLFDLTEQGDVITATSRGVTCLDPETGAVKWRRDDARMYADGIDANGRVWAVLHMKQAGTEIIDPATGQTLWKLLDRVPGELRGAVQHGRTGSYLAFSKLPEGALVLTALDLESGAQRWRQDSLFVRWAEPRSASGKSIDMGGRQGAMSTGDSTACFWPTVGGPIRVNLRDGSLLWRSEDFERRLPEEPKEGDPRWTQVGDVALAASKKNLVGVRLSDGAVLWSRKADYPCDINMLHPSETRLVVVGLKKPFIDVLDPLTGASVLKSPVRKVDGLSSLESQGDLLYFTTSEKLETLDLLTGERREVGSFELKHEDRIRTIEVRENGFLLRGAQNLVSLDRQGVVRYERDFEAPGAGLLFDLMDFALFAAGGAYSPPMRYPKTAFVPECVYFFTERPDPSGKKGFRLARIDVETGAETGSVWIDERHPTYRLDHSAGRVYVLATEREIRAMKF